jgi:hypothetical protein
LKEAPEGSELEGRGGWHVGRIFEDNEKLKNKQSTLYRMCLISYAVLNKCSYETTCKASIKDLIDARQRVGQINVCKIKTTTGKYSAQDLTDGYNIWKSVLDKQINALQPELIICGNTLQYFPKTNDYLERTENNKKLLASIVPNNNEKFCYYPEKDKLLINIHHPSDRNVNWEHCINELVGIVSDWDKRKNKNG